MNRYAHKKVKKKEAISRGSLLLSELYLHVYKCQQWINIGTYCSYHNSEQNNNLKKMWFT